MAMRNKLDNIYILNPIYILRNDISRIVLATNDLKNFESSKHSSIITFIHPIYAAMLSFFRGDNTLKDNIHEISLFMNITKEQAFNIVVKFLENKSPISVEYDNNFFYFPDNILIQKQSNHRSHNYAPHDFLINENFDCESARLNIPLEASILINNRCATDCIYCYADKREIYDCIIPLERLKELVLEARKIGITAFDIQGGELFLYKHWDELLKVLIEANYNVYISTKFPLVKKNIKYLKSLGINEIQISLDSIFEEDLILCLGVSKKYHTEILNTINELNYEGFHIKIKAVITAPIFNLEKTLKYIEYFKQYNNVDIVELTVPSHSLYKSQEDFNNYKLSISQIESLKEFVIEQVDNCKPFFSLELDVPERKHVCKSFEDKLSLFNRRSKCSGNLSSFIILPNGDIGLCEETYFNKNFILGNILNKSIMEVWGSQEAREMFYLKQSDFPQNSPCSKCLEFEPCRHCIGVCWTDAMAAYGEENWLYPVPDCPYAPNPINDTKVW